MNVEAQTNRIGEGLFACLLLFQLVVDTYRFRLCKTVRCLDCLIHSLYRCPLTSFFPALLRYNGCLTLCKLKVQSLMIWYIAYCVMIILTAVSISVTLQSDMLCVCLMRTFKIRSPSYFRGYTVALLTVVSVLYVRSPALTRLITGSLYPLTIFTHFLSP